MSLRLGVARAKCQFSHLKTSTSLLEKTQRRRPDKLRAMKQSMSKQSRSAIQRLDSAGYGVFASAMKLHGEWRAFCYVGKCNWVKSAAGSRSIEASMWSHLRRFHKLPNPGLKIRSGAQPEPWVAMLLPKLRRGFPVSKKLPTPTSNQLLRAYRKHHPRA